ncbi:malonyl-ACP O-methyltransferase BioC [Marinobacter zhejiangensis]|uniref:Malonyl-[acyl-carrier protein] O-methyltransferase n=1 Tax=Marinobacter zhejiangensis TaxID=488535 RepID=A0A1I4QJD7_9GAMM|nr:malonyl-ACP O-methyltransferase BioC [Marinobacter zhejiangensis]SFM40147.1 malonyl-CoA O-methyltransferase [Marinobacter zhejiangensis]
MAELIAEKTSVARDFGGASASYDEAARLQRHMGQRLLDLFAGCGPVDQILDLGCGTGQFAEGLQQEWPGASLAAVDLSEAMIRHAREHRSGSVRWAVADAESLPFTDQSMDVIFSNLMIQWCADPRPVLKECLRVLRPGGRLMCSTLLEGTLAELAAAWQVVDPGVSHINRFESCHRLEQQLLEVFAGARVEQETIRLPYRSPLLLLNELKSLGAQYKGEGRRRTLTAPGRIRRLCQAYERESGQVFATYQAGYLVCQKSVG